MTNDYEFRLFCLIRDQICEKVNIPDWANQILPEQTVFFKSRGQTLNYYWETKHEFFS